jgi:cytidine deaminase
LREFASPHVEVHCATPSGALATYAVEALLPVSFGPDHLADGT